MHVKNVIFDSLVTTTKIMKTNLYITKYQKSVFIHILYSSRLYHFYIYHLFNQFGNT